MPIVLHHHPYSRAANVVWMLEELGQPYTFNFVDMARDAYLRWCFYGPSVIEPGKRLRRAVGWGVRPTRLRGRERSGGGGAWAEVVGR